MELRKHKPSSIANEAYKLKLYLCLRATNHWSREERLYVATFLVLPSSFSPCPSDGLQLLSSRLFLKIESHFIYLCIYVLIIHTTLADPMTDPSGQISCLMRLLRNLM
jgi:hypothetical protein